jgi:hypothetical protein
MVLKALTFFQRLGALATSIVVLGLGTRFIINRTINIELLIYIEVIASLGVLGSLIPPYPNFLYDFTWTVAWLLAAIFTFVTQVNVSYLTIQRALYLLYQISIHTQS